MRWDKWIQQLAEKISWDISKSGDDPLDGDETSRIGCLLTLELDRMQGNVTDEEYNERLYLIEKRGDFYERCDGE